LSRAPFTPSITAPLWLVSDGPGVALASLKAWGCDGAELLGWQVTSLPEPKRQALRQRLCEAGLPVAFITATGPGGEGWTLESLREAYALAGMFEAECVVSAAPPRGSDRGLNEGQAVEWLLAATALAEANGAPLLVENRPGSWAGTGQAHGQFIDRVDSPWLGAAFNPAGFAALREHPFLTAFMPGHLKRRLHLLRIRDAHFEDGGTVRLNEGNAEIAEIVSALMARGFGGFLAVDVPCSEPEEARLALADLKQLLAML
jgi:sugar phosphate isomerase/epimerase